VFETIGAAFVIIVILVILAYHAAEIIGCIGGPVQEWFNETYGYPRKVKTGKEGLLNKTAIVITKFKNDSQSTDVIGQVNIHGEIWRAKTRRSSVQMFEVGDKVIVSGIEGLTLEVEAHLRPSRTTCACGQSDPQLTSSSLKKRQFLRETIIMGEMVFRV
jgi:membrane protein implicated in regulation of membrane protease activity